MTQPIIVLDTRDATHRYAIELTQPHLSPLDCYTQAYTLHIQTVADEISIETHGPLTRPDAFSLYFAKLLETNLEPEFQIKALTKAALDI